MLYVLDTLDKRWGEKPILIGTEETFLEDGAPTEVMISVLVNMTTKTFTVVQQMPLNTQLLCIIGSGKIRKFDNTVFTNSFGEGTQFELEGPLYEIGY